MQYNPHEQNTTGAGDVFGGVTNLRPEAARRFNDSNGGFIAVSYEARARGVKRGMRGCDARKVCPEVQIVQARLESYCRAPAVSSAATQHL